MFYYRIYDLVVNFYSFLLIPLIHLDKDLQTQFDNSKNSFTNKAGKNC